MNIPCITATKPRIVNLWVVSFLLSISSACGPLLTPLHLTATNDPGTDSGLENVSGWSITDTLVRTTTAQTPFASSRSMTPTSPLTPTEENTVSPSGWKYIWKGNPDHEISITELVIDPLIPTTLYAVESEIGGVIKSVDGGQNWSKIDNGIADLYIDDLAIDPETPTTLYAGTNHGVYKSRDEGGSWIGVNTDFLNSSVYDLAIDPVTPTTIYAGTDRGIFKSTDGGGKWSAVNNGFIDYNYFGRRDMWICKLVIDPSTPTTLYAGGDLHLFKSTDGGGNWSMVSTLNKIPMHVCSMAIDPLKPNILYAVIGDINHGTAVFKSIDGGGSWISINSNIDDIEGMIDVIAIDPKTPTTIYIGVFEGSGGLSRGGVFKSTDGGLHWFNIGPSGTIVNDLAINPQSPNILYAGTNDGIYYLRQVP